MTALITHLLREHARRRRIREAVLEHYEVTGREKVRRLEVARKVAETLGVHEASPAFQLEVMREVETLGAWRVKQGNARFWRGLKPRATAGNG